MVPGVLGDREDEPPPAKTPYLSHSRINRYLTCPEQYRLYYIENLRPRFPSASLVFGQVIHEALAHLFRGQGDPVRFFLERWEDVRTLELTYAERDTWEKLRASGEALLERFVREELPQMGEVIATEKLFELGITSLDLPFVGIIDLVAQVKGKLTVVDFKTSGSAYQGHEAAMSDQLTAYQLAQPETEQAALCVLVRTKTPRIEWAITSRTGEQLLEYLTKAQLVAQEITARHFYKRPGKWCSWCDYLPVCLGDQEKVRKTLFHLS